MTAETQGHHAMHARRTPFAAVALTVGLAFGLAGCGSSSSKLNPGGTATRAAPTAAAATGAATGGAPVATGGATTGSSPALDASAAAALGGTNGQCAGLLSKLSSASSAFEGATSADDIKSKIHAYLAGLNDAAKGSSTKVQQAVAAFSAAYQKLIDGLGSGKAPDTTAIVPAAQALEQACVAP